MIPIQHKIDLVQNYIFQRKGRKVRITFSDDINHSRELDMLNEAYKHAYNYFTK